MNVKVTGVPMRTRRMSISDDPRVGQLVATTGPKRGVGMQTLTYESSTTTSQHATRDPTTQQQGWRCGPVSPGDWITPMGPGRTSTVHGCLVRQGGCGWPETTTTTKTTTARSDMVAEPWLNVRPG